MQAAYFNSLTSFKRVVMHRIIYLDFFFRYSMSLKTYEQFMQNNTFGHGPLHKDEFRDSSL